MSIMIRDKCPPSHLPLVTSLAGAQPALRATREQINTRPSPHFLLARAAHHAQYCRHQAVFSQTNERFNARYIAVTAALSQQCHSSCIARLSTVLPDQHHLNMLTPWGVAFKVKSGGEVAPTSRFLAIFLGRPIFSQAAAMPLFTQHLLLRRENPRKSPWKHA